MLESYITHIRITEDAAHPSSPPPPNSSPETKKPRLVIVAVRKSGRVRMHKARENTNGSFSIGKTWMLDDLTAVKSYSGSTPSNLEEEQHKQWAGGTGFIVSIGKPYYWQANTQKEKQFFIASLVKIYTKYTGGKSPELVGFDSRERDQLLGVSGSGSSSTAGAAAGAGARPSPPSLQSTGGPAPRPPFGQAQGRPLRPEPPPERALRPERSQERVLRPEPSQERVLRPQLSRDAMQRPQGRMPPPGGSSGGSFNSQTSRPDIRGRREDSPASMESGGPGPQQNLPPLRRFPPPGQSQEPFGRGDDNRRLPSATKSPELFGRNGDIPNIPPRSRGGSNGTQNAPGRFPDRSVTPISQRAVTPDNGMFGVKDTLNDAPPVPAPLALPPERRRPLLPSLNDSSRRDLNVPDKSIMPAPLSSPGMRRDRDRDDLRPPARSSDRTTPPRERDANLHMTSIQPNIDTTIKSETPRKVSEDTGRSESMKSSSSIPATVPPQPSAATPEPQVPVVPVVPPMPDEPEEEARPGLGPMIKKKTKGDIANTIFKAAKTTNALNAFKARAGGAAERLREMQAKSTDGPDGISGVVPAPSLVRGMSGSDSTAPPPPTAPLPEKPPQPKQADSIPEVKITVPEPSLSKSAEPPTQPQQENAISDKSKGREVRRRKPVSETMQKELASLGVDPSVLGGRGSEVVEFWEQFGWVGDGIRTKNIDQMQEEIDRELNKVQAGGWLAKLDEEDDRIEAVKSGLDKCIDECDELDGLLTLYSVELSVSLLPILLLYLLIS